jgi:hypothetical protein
MWAESYNTHYLIDGGKMRDTWGYIMPHLVEDKANLDKIVEKIKFALFEDEANVVSLSPDMQRIRLRDGLLEMDGGYNNKYLPDSDLCLISD